MNATSSPVFRNVPGRVVAGVCAAIAQRLNMEVALIRVLFVVSLAFTGGLAFWVYFAAWLCTPWNESDKAPLRRIVDAVLEIFGAPRPGSIETL